MSNKFQSSNVKNQTLSYFVIGIWDFIWHLSFACLSTRADRRRQELWHLLDIGYLKLDFPHFPRVFTI